MIDRVHRSLPVEARSLSSLTNLAANPPQYPRNPTHAALDPIVLYIVRVPGSRDVFLTPLKPPTKTSITADAINSSLYYLHVSNPDDDSFRKSLEEQHQSFTAEQTSCGPVISRRPVPSSLALAKQVVSQPPKSPDSHAGAQPVVLQKPPYFQSTTKATKESQLGMEAGRVEDMGESISRKLIGPRPLPSTSRGPVVSVVRKPVGAQPVNAKEASLIGQASLITEGDSETPTNVLRSKPTAQSNVGASPARWPSPIRQATTDFDDQRVTAQDHSMGAVHDSTEAEDLNITLIRRDPTSAAQWNVGIIRVRSPTLSVVVEISNPGYQKYPKAIDSRDSIEPPKAISSNEASNKPSSNMFTRKLAISFPGSSQGRTRAQSQPSQDSFESQRESQRQSSPSKASQLRNAHFSFLSPWNGTCAFSTGTNGRSFRCRHSLPSNTVADIGNASAPVAEIRFNLPWVVGKQTARERGVSLRGGEAHEGFSSRPSRPTLINTLGKGDQNSSAGNVAKTAFRNSWQKIKDRSLNRESSEDNALQGPPILFQPLALPPRPLDQGTHDRRGSSIFSQEAARSEDVDEGAAMDLTLGREKAGGGFKGKSAKLGKLVIEDEGLKMCDLTVAMCMALWWLYY